MKPTEPIFECMSSHDKQLGKAFPVITQNKANKYGVKRQLDPTSNCDINKEDRCTNASIITPPRVLDRELILRNYRQINSKVRAKLEQDRQSRRFLFTFDPAKIRINSPIVRCTNNLLKETGFRNAKN